MDDNFGKYLRLFGTLFFTFIGFIVAFILLMLGVRLFFGILSYIPWLTYLYMILILIFPTALFVTAYVIYFRRTRMHPSKIVKFISYTLFIVAIGLWLYFFMIDMKLFFKYFYGTIDRYQTYNLLFLACNVGCIFFVGVMQAFSTEKEQDWMEKRRQKMLKEDL